MDSTKGSEIGHQYPQNWSLSCAKPSIVFLVNCFEPYPNITSYHNIYHLIPCKHSKIWCSWALECVYHYFSWILTASTSETWFLMGSKHHFCMETMVISRRLLRKTPGGQLGATLSLLEAGIYPGFCYSTSYHQFMNRGFTSFLR